MNIIAKDVIIYLSNKFNNKYIYYIILFNKLIMILINDRKNSKVLSLKK